MMPGDASSEGEQGDARTKPRAPACRACAPAHYPVPAPSCKFIILVAGPVLDRGIMSVLAHWTLCPRDPKRLLLCPFSLFSGGEGITPSSALCSGISPGNAQWTTWGARDGTRAILLQARQTPTYYLSAPRPVSSSSPQELVLSRSSSGSCCYGSFLLLRVFEVRVNFAQ